MHRNIVGRYLVLDGCCLDTGRTLEQNMNVRFDRSTQ